MTTAGLINAFGVWSEERKPMVLASVFETKGSTYTKAGAQMIIGDNGNFQGMLSGGCLEGDLAERARAVLESGACQSVTYDLSQNDEELWGLGVGCNGLMRIFLQPLLPNDNYEPFTTMVKSLKGDNAQVAATVVESEIQSLRAGATIVTVAGELAFSSVDEEHSQKISEIIGLTLLEGRSNSRTISDESGSATVLFSLLRPPPSILVLGAGLDAEPVVRFAKELGWRVTVQDHRSAYIETGEFGAAEKIHCVPVKEFSKTVALDRYAAAIVMSHHLVSDREYLRQLAMSRIAYVGLLGPLDRRVRLLEELGAVSGRLEGRIHGPAGVDIGGRGPASIALSIIAEMHHVLMQNENAD